MKRLIEYVDKMMETRVLCIQEFLHDINITFDIINIVLYYTNFPKVMDVIIDD
jgi:hypothetical protein